MGRPRQRPTIGMDRATTRSSPSARRLYEVPADPLNLCNGLDNLIFGSYATNASGQATQAGGPDVSIQVNFGVPAIDWQDQGLQPPTLNVDLIDGGVRWFASTERGLGAVDSRQLADGKATGEASFVGEVVPSHALARGSLREPHGIHRSAYRSVRVRPDHARSCYSAHRISTGEATSIHGTP